MWLFLACSSAPTTIQSVPAEPTKDLRPVDQPVVVTDLVDLLPEAPASLPAPLAGLTPKMAGEAARAILEAAHEPGVRIFGEMGDTQYALTTLIRGYDNVGITLVFSQDGKTLQEVDVSVPDEVAIPMLTTRWGPPTEQVPGDGAKMLMRWTPPSGAWRVELMPYPGQPSQSPLGDRREKAIIRYLPRG